MVAIDGNRLSFDAGEETLSRTTLGDVKAGDSVNVESSLRMGDSLGGHLVSGHIDAVGTVDQRQDVGIAIGKMSVLEVQVQEQRRRRGSIA